MATAKQTQSRRTDDLPLAAAKRRFPRKSNLRELYARLEKTQPGSEESKRISARIVDAIG